MDGELDDRVRGRGDPGAGQRRGSGPHLAHLPPDRRRDAREPRALGGLHRARRRSGSPPSPRCSRRAPRAGLPSDRAIVCARPRPASVAAVAFVGWMALRAATPGRARRQVAQVHAGARSNPTLVPLPTAAERLSARAPGLLAARLAAGHGALCADRRRARGRSRASELAERPAGRLCAGCAPGRRRRRRRSPPETLGWLRKIHDATQKLSYTGTFVYQNGGRSETSRITRYADARRHRAARSDGRRAARDRAHARTPCAAICPARAW